MKEEKNTLRKELLKKLLSLTQGEIRRRSDDVGKILSNLPIYKQAKCVMAYYPLKGEVDLLDMLRKSKDKMICFPVVDMISKELAVFAVKDFDCDFVLGPLGVRQPDTDKATQVDRNDIDVVIIPGIAFDKNKNRLGRGGGFYDRFIKTLPNKATKIGVAFDFQLLENLPACPPFDEAVDTVISERISVQ
ncbi:MAG: 5-formyltetrahydrofolate cyclo-ligase [Candidatus Omnitrophica bacterium]|nr:5-formyltetrahydrofolate cyclo-ligase [Candidatus Omnitrophota bacterium]